jgi:hypothetical protein
MLTAAGYNFSSDWGPRPLGFVQAIAIDSDTGELTAAADSVRMNVARALAF